MTIRTLVQKAKQVNVKRKFVLHRCGNYVDYPTM